MEDLARLIAGLVLYVFVTGVAHAETPVPDEETQAVADEAGVDSLDLLGATVVTGVDARTYARSEGLIQSPEPVFLGPTGRLVCIARYESHNDTNATNPRSGAAGLYQFLHSTWLTTPQGKQGLSPYNPVASTAAAQWMLQQGRANEWDAVRYNGC